MSIKKIAAEDLRRMKDSEGLILQGCGGELQEWLDGINDMFTEEKLLLNGTKFEDIYAFEHDGLHRGHCGKAECPNRQPRCAAA